MARPRVFVARRMLDPIRAELEASFDLDLHDSREPLPADELAARAAGCDGVVVITSDRADAALLDAAGPRLRVVANHGVGHDNVDVAAATARGVLVSYTPGVLTETVAELTIALALSLLRRVTEGDRVLRRGQAWPFGFNAFLGRGLDGLLLGLVGHGRIAQATERLARAHGMEVVHSSRRGGLPLDDLLARADVVSLHLPLTPESRHLIDARALSLMKPEAVLVNTSRGPIVDEAALAAALAAGRPGGAALDVFEREPEVTEALLGLENVVLAPHIGSATVTTRTAMGMLCVEALRAVLLEDRVPSNALNPEVWRR